MTVHDATRRQIRAANPGRSSWVSANAGSGKTRVLTSRVARMLFHGVPPARILCLTYTKAAASEMQIRLFETLGGWSMATDADLRQELTSLGEAGPLSASDLRRARQMFATAIETPGGLKIQTIHAFCSSVLRRFPLEAGVSPNFRELDERGTKNIRLETLEELAQGDPEVFDALCFHAPSDIENLCADVVRNSGRFREASAKKIWADFELPRGFDEQALLSEYRFAESDLVSLRAFRDAEFEKPTDQKNAIKLLGLSLDDLTLRDVPLLEDVFLAKANAKSPFSAKIGSVPTKDGRVNLGSHIEALEDLMLRIQDSRPRRLALTAARRTLALHRFAHAFLRRYKAKKDALGSLDFDDLISKTLTLLSDSEAADWVMYRLDGGIDHILVDEAQDTSPQQWEIIRCLAGEFTAGEGARDELKRTIFAVGDRKQSIYSFQGAAPQAFEEMRDSYGEKLRQIGSDLQRVELSHSFRSSSAILEFVDTALRPYADHGVGDHIDHIAFKSELPGRVDVWPVIEPSGDKTDKPKFHEPVDLVSADHPSRQLAAEIALEIKGILDRGERIEDQNGSRPIRPGDFLILVQKRSGILFQEILRNLKAAELDVSGSDVLVLSSELAVKDLVSLLSFLALPDDDLALAEVMRSPLLGLSEADLFAVAHPRSEGQTLWSALQAFRPKDDPVRLVLHDLLKLADLFSPFELLDRVLTRHRGRQLLIGRLGLECEEAIDALLSLALTYERQETPSLVGFLSWFGSDDVKIRRQMDGEGNLIRVMTSHGAKGLEAPIVILPDTARPSSQTDSAGILFDESGPMWPAVASEIDPRSTAAKESAKRLAEEERKRLLYVAMTRAESWLIVCGAGKTGDGNWHSIASDAMASLPHDKIKTPAGVRFRYSKGEWPAPSVVSENGDTGPRVLQEWIDTKVRTPASHKKILSPSMLGGDKSLLSEGAGNADTSMDRGTAVHRLLEVLPTIHISSRLSMARALLGERPDFDDVFLEATGVLENQDLAFVFSENAFAEVPISAELEELGSIRIGGIIDRLLVSDERVLIVDFKTNIAVPSSPKETPEGLLRQLGAYQAAVRQMFPDQRIETAILWTRNSSLMYFPHDIVMRALTRTATS